MLEKHRIEDIKKNRRTQTKHNPEKAKNAKHSKTKLAWFSRLLRHSARKQGELMSPHGAIKNKHSLETKNHYIISR